MRSRPPASAAIVAMAVGCALLTASPTQAGPSTTPGAALQPTRITGWNDAAKRVTPGARLSDKIRIRTGGKATPRTVALLRARTGSKGWATIWRGRTNTGGRLTLRFTAPRTGDWKYRVRVRGNRTAAPATSTSKRIVTWTPTPSDTKSGGVDTPPAPATPLQIDVTGDIGQCGGAADKTAALISQSSGVVVATGDLAYPNGTEADFANCYDPHYGRFKNTTFPVPGNHEYNSGASAYFAYFGARVGTPAQPWYAVDIGAWRFYMLNSNCAQVGGCGTGSAQHAWLMEQLSDSQPRCTAAVWHHPRWSSGVHGPNASTSALYDALLARGTDLLLTGHEHNYERFARLNSAGQSDPSGIREFVVGTGGTSLREIPGQAAGSEVRLNDSHGVLRLTLDADQFAWRFLPTEATGLTDAGSERCS